jgi:hypothetical protein
MSNASATTITVNTGLFAAGDTVTILNIGAGVCTVTAGTATVSKPTNATLALVQNAGGVLYFTATGTAIFMPFDVGAAATAFAGSSVYNSANQSINNATLTAVTFNSESFDTDAYHSTATNTSRFTIPSGKAGKYLVSATLNFGSNATGVRYISLYKNGAAVIYGNSVPGSSAGGTALAMSYLVDLAVSDYIELYAYQSTGVAADVLGGSTLTVFQLHYLGA